MNDVKKYIYLTVVIFLFGVLAWFGVVFYNSCGFSTSCPDGALLVERTPIPTLIPATLPAADRFVSASNVEAASAVGGTGVARPSNPGGPGPGVELTGKAEVGKIVFDERCAVCHGSEGMGGLLNPGSTDGTMPALNPIDESLKDADYQTFAINLDLFLEHGSMPEGKNPIFQMPDWGDKGILTPQQIADLIAYIISLNP